MNCPYIKPTRKLAKLIRQYEAHGTIVIGFDFDFTLYDSTNPYDEAAFYSDMLALARRAQNSPACVTCLWTASDDIVGILNACETVGLKFNYINESPLVHGDPEPRKSHFNLLLDDAAGLGESVRILEMFLDSI